MDNILITGDYCPIGNTLSLSQSGKYEKIFNDFLPIICNAELAITNLECPLINDGKAIKKTGPALKAPIDTIKALKYAGFNLLTLSNNHIMDYGSEGLRSTLKLCEENNINYTGAGKNLKEVRKIYYHTIGNLKVAIINISENEFSTTEGEQPGANPLSLPKNFQDIKIAKKNSDFTIIIFHGGNEMYQLPSPRIKETFRFFVEAGANCVIGHHAHCFSGYEVYQGANIFYGLGNFVFDYDKVSNPIWNEGYAVSLTFSDNNTSVGYEIIPYFQNLKTTGVQLMNDNEKVQFNERLYGLNKIIADDTALEFEFGKFIKRKKVQYKNYLEPVSNKIIRKLVEKEVLPSMLGKEKKLLYLNLIRCEAHRDIIINILKNDDRLT